MNLTFSQASSNNSFLISGITISSFEILRPEIVAFSYQKFLISFTNLAVTDAHNSSNDLANTFFNTHFQTVSLTKPNSFGTISLNNNLP
jgi:hypothetical protein